MEELVPFVIGLLKSDPVKAVVVVLLFLCVALFLELKKRFTHDLTRFEKTLGTFTTKMGYWEERISMHTAETGKSLLRHSEDMGKATKAINGDFLKIHEAFLAMKQQTIDEIEKLKSFSATLERQFLLIAQKCDLSVDAINEKFGRIIEIKKNLETLNGKVILIEENVGKQSTRMAKHEEHFTTVGNTLANHKSALEQIQSEIKKAKRGKHDA